MKITKGAVCKPGTLTVNKTGGWRTYMPVFDYSLCIRCGICETVCPDMSVFSDVSSVDEKNRYLRKVDYDFCKGCGICANECPKGVITMTLEEK